MCISSTVTTLIRSECILWMGNGEIACNLKLIPHHIKSILTSYGKGMERSDVYQGNISFMDISLRTAMNAYFAFMFGGMFRRLVCKLRPYEIEKGVTDRILNDSLSIRIDAFYTGGSKEGALFIQNSPACCCPSLVTEAMARTIEGITGVPVVCVTYDGTCGNKNNAIIPYLAYQNSGPHCIKARPEKDTPWHVMLILAVGPDEIPWHCSVFGLLCTIEKKGVFYVQNCFITCAASCRACQGIDPADTGSP